MPFLWFGEGSARIFFLEMPSPMFDAGSRNHFLDTYILFAAMCSPATNAYWERFIYSYLKYFDAQHGHQNVQNGQNLELTKIWCKIRFWCCSSEGCKKIYCDSGQTKNWSMQKSTKSTPGSTDMVGSKIWARFWRRTRREKFGFRAYQKMYWKRTGRQGQNPNTGFKKNLKIQVKAFESTQGFASGVLLRYLIKRKDSFLAWYGKM